MSEKILIIGESGSGKSRSTYSLNPKDTFYINVIGKSLPFKGWRSSYTLFDRETGNGNMVSIYEADKVLNAMKYVSDKRPEIKVLIIDDAQYIMAYEFMERAKEKGFDKFVEIGQNMFNILKLGDNLRADLMVVFLFHSDDISANGYTKTKVKTIGKMLDEKITVEGMFTVVLQAMCYKDTDKTIKYCFVTQNNGTTTVKTPEGMFSSPLIENDLAAVIKRYKEYNQ